MCHVCSSLPQKHLGLPASQVLGLFNRIIRKFVQLFNSLSEVAMGDSIPATGDIDMKPLEMSVDKELVSQQERGRAFQYCLLPLQAEAAQLFHEDQEKKRAQLQTGNLSQYAVGGADDEWAGPLSTAPNIISVRC